MGSFGVCPKCPKGTRAGRLYGEGVCLQHLRAPDSVEERNPAPNKLKEIAANKQTLTVWFNMQLKQSPERCENCNTVIVIPYNLPKRTRVCHIVPKSSIDSVKTHPLNRWFGCWQCHTNYDQWPAEKVATMNVIKVCRERFAIFETEIAEDEKKYIPNYLITKK